jgi:putative tryptophan/tyrosine transport system substrate-binding protein
VRRREFNVLFASAALTAPLAAYAQQRSMPVVGFLDSAAGTAAKLIEFYEGLKIEGYVRNQNLAVAYHSAQGDYSRLPALAADLVNRQVSLVAAIGIAAALAAKNATSAIPIVFAVESDPVRLGLIGSLDKPGGNVTGVADMAVGREQKRLELLHELLPTATVLALLVNPDNPAAETQTRDALAAARAIGVELKVIRASAESGFEAAFAELAQAHAGGLAIGDDELFISAGAHLAALAVRHTTPAIFQGRDFAVAGGLTSYGSNLMETYHQAGAYSGLILKGAAPAGLPVYQSTRIEFIVNLRSAKAFGIAVPPAWLGQANEVIK